MFPGFLEGSKQLNGMEQSKMRKLAFVRVDWDVGQIHRLSPRSRIVCYTFRADGEKSHSKCLKRVFLVLELLSRLKEPRMAEIEQS